MNYDTPEINNANKSEEKIDLSFGSANGRWARFGPYYAMFPFDFATNVIQEFSKKGDWIIDPFAGRSTSIFAAAAQGRFGLGIEIFPVGWLFGRVKISPSPLINVEKRLDEILGNSNSLQIEADALPEFFHFCFSKDVRCFLLAARNSLDWQDDLVDMTLMAFILVYLHGKIGEGLSNQLRQTKAMAPDYSIMWWKKNNYFDPPKINVGDFLKQRLRWRYLHGIPDVTNSEVILGDSTKILPGVVADVNEKRREKFSLLFTSPPYNKVTNYFKDQWLRLWMLGGPDHPQGNRDDYEGRFFSEKKYYDLLDNVFKNCRYLLQDNGAIYIRTDARRYTFETTLSILKKNFSGWKEQVIPAPVTGHTQTDLFNKSVKEAGEKVGEMDILMKGPNA